MVRNRFDAILSEPDYLLLREVLTRHAPELLPIIEERVLPPLTDMQREELRVAIAAELGDTGFDVAGPITERGRSLESLIDHFGHA